MPARVHVAHTVRSEILTWARQADGSGIGGLLFGHVHEGPVPFVRVEAALLAQGAGSVGSSIRFTSELVAELTERGRGEYPGLVVVGWFHTHAGLGAFLSGYDASVHKEHFPAPWQVALVLDTELGREALYVRDGQELVPAPSLVAGRAVGEVAAARWAPGRTHYRLAHPGRFLVALGVALLIIGTVLVLAWWGRRTTSPGVKSSAVQPPAPAAAPVTPGSARPEATPPGNQVTSPPPAPSSAPSSSAGRTAAGGEKYTVRPGDTLWGICERFYGRGELYQDLARENRLADPRLLIPGQELFLPAAFPAELPPGA